ncbi:unnamed protein product [Rotaria socialis]|uniref:Uncharacterized protein n=1 Tax=Rotaria socialis TaxID=392032 RepID=A0A818WGB1_9BILA|nr:unnamed protein product [Rotaria socialis]
MFPDSHIANDYSLRPQKLSYVVSHGTSYYFNNELIKDVRKAHGFLLLFDETTIVGVRKQLDIFFPVLDCNSDVEWGFLQNNHLVTDERSSLNEASINGLRATNAGIKFFGDSKVPITNSLLFSVQQSYSRYAKDNDRQQKLVKNVDTVNGKRTIDT